jgi:hypothetical protein
MSTSNAWMHATRSGAGKTLRQVYLALALDADTGPPIQLTLISHIRVGFAFKVGFGAAALTWPALAPASLQHTRSAWMQSSSMAQFTNCHLLQLLIC